MWAVTFKKGRRDAYIEVNGDVININNTCFIDVDEDRYITRNALCMCCNLIRKGWMIMKCVSFPNIEVIERSEYMRFKNKMYKNEMLSQCICIPAESIYSYEFNTNTYWKNKKTQVVFKTEDTLTNALVIYRDMFCLKYCEFTLVNNDIWLIAKTLKEYRDIQRVRPHANVYVCPYIEQVFEIQCPFNVVRSLTTRINYIL